MITFFIKSTVLISVKVAICCMIHFKAASSLAGWLADAAQRLYVMTSGSRGLALCHL